MSEHILYMTMTYGEIRRLQQALSLARARMLEIEIETHGRPAEAEAEIKSLEERLDKAESYFYKVQEAERISLELGNRNAPPTPSNARSE